MKAGNTGARRLAWLIAAGGLLLAPAASAEDNPSGPDTALRVLPAGVERAVEAAFLRAAPAWRLATAKVEKVTVAAKVCTEAGACHDVVLSDPRPTCKGTRAGPWCVIWQGSAPAAAATLEAALAKDDDAAIWRVIAARPKQPAIMEPVAAAGAATQAGAAAGSAHAQPAGRGAAGAGANNGNGSDPSEPREGDNSTLLIIALVAAALATFILFRRSDDEDVDGDADGDADQGSDKDAPSDTDGGPKA